MATEKYQWMVKPKGAPDAKTTALAIKEIRRKTGKDATPVLLLEAARSPKHVLHDAFEWDDSAAAERWRLTQAGLLIRNLRIVKVADDKSQSERVIQIRAFSRIEVDGEDDVYKPTMECLKVPSERAQIIEHAKAKLRECRGIIRDLEEFSGVAVAIDQVLAS